MFNNAFFSLKQIESIKSSNSGKLRELVEKCLQDADEKLNANRLQDGILSLAFGYYYTGEEKYWNKAKDLIDACVNSKRWENHEFGSSDLGTASESIAMASAYSLFGDKFSEEDRKKIAETTYKRGVYPIFRDWVLPSEKQHAIDTMGHNWWLVCVASGALAAVVIKEDIPECEKLYKMADKGIQQWFEYKGNPLNCKPQNIDNGGFYESISYLDYPLHEYLTYAIAHKNLTGESPFDDKEIVSANAKFLINCSYYTDNKNYHVPFGDTSGQGSFNSTVDLLLYGIDMPEIRWHVQNEININNNLIRRTLAYFETYEKPSNSPEKLSECYDKIGWAVFRDSFEKNGTMLAVKCGDTWNHAHADAAHFVLYRNGNTEIYDSLKPNNYGNKLYIKYYVESEAHNVLLFEGKGQDVRDNYKNHAHCRGQLYNYIDDRGFRYVVADATGPMSRYFRKHHRHFLWLDKFIFIYDDVECYENGEVNFLLHAQENNSFKMLTPATETEHMGFLKNEKDQDYVVYYKSYNRKTDDEGHVKFVSIISLDDSVNPVYEEIENGLKVTVGDTKVYVNTRSDGKVMHKNGISTLDGITTDAMILVDANGKYGVANGSIVRKDGISHLDTWVRITGWVDTAEKI